MHRSVIMVSTGALLTIGGRAATAPRDSASDSIHVAQLRELRVIGDLEQPLGTIVTIEARWKDMSFTRAKADDGRLALDVHSVNSQPLDTIVRIHHFSRGWSPPRGTRDGDPCRLTGYESGGFRGEPDGAGAFRKGPVVARVHVPFRFDTEFVVLQIEEPRSPKGD